MVTEIGNPSQLVDVDLLVIEENDEAEKIDKFISNDRKIDKIDKVLKISEIFLKIGQFVFTEVAPILGDIMGVGNIVRSIISLFPPEDKKELENKLKDLEKKIETLSDMMNSKFDDLKAFITEVNFYVEIMNPVSNLMKFMMDCMKHPSDEAVENFKEAYARHPPMALAYSFLGLLEHKTTNPLKMAMDADVLKTSTTFNKWENIFKGVLAEFLFLEAFADGLFEKVKKYNSERIIERSERLFEQLDHLRKDYTKNNKYWSILRKYMEETLNTHADLSNKMKADKMKEILDTILTADSFYLIVFDNWKKDRYINYTFKCFKEYDIIEMYGVARGNAVIYRSMNANRNGIEDVLKEIRVRVENTHFNVNEFMRDPKGYPEKLMPELRFALYVCVIGFLNEEIRWANCSQNDGQPGWCHRMESDPDRQGKRTYRMLIAGYV